MNLLALFGRRPTGTILDTVQAMYRQPMGVSVRGPAQLDNMPQIDAEVQFVPGNFTLPTQSVGPKARPGQKRGRLPKSPQGGSCG